MKKKFLSNENNLVADEQEKFFLKIKFANYHGDKKSLTFNVTICRMLAILLPQTTNQKWRVMFSWFL